MNLTLQTAADSSSGGDTGEHRAAPRIPTPTPAELYAAYSGAVARRVSQFFPSSEVDEAVQDIFLRVVERIDSFRGRCHPFTWLYRLATNHCLTVLRKRRRRQELMLTLPRIPWQPELAPTDVEAAVFLKQLWRSVDPELAEVGVYYHVDGLTQDEIGGLLGVSGRTISTRLRQLSEAARQGAGMEDP